jgi:GT2 family glycosyltransferase
MASTIRGDMVHPLMGWNADNPKCNISREVLAVTGASFIVRRSVFQRVRGFDPVYSLGYFEDMDLCFSIRFKEGRRIYITTDAVATHGVAQTMKNEQSTPMQKNQTTFKSRWVSFMPWSDWEIW